MQRFSDFLEQLSKFIKGSNKASDKAAFDILFRHFEKGQKKATGLSPFDKEQHAEELYSRIQQIIEKQEQTVNKKRRQIIRMTTRGWAAAAVLLVLVSSTAGYLWIPQVQQSIVAWIQVEKTAAPGKTQQVILSDGTNILLNAGSRISYPRFFIGPTREVILSGEAFFRVSRDVKHPFIVRTAKVTTRVLGTSFNIKAYRLTGHTTVTVATGKVQVSRGNLLLSDLTANQEIIINNHTGRFSLNRQVETASRLAWESGDLVFENTPLDEVITILTNRYNVKFQGKVSNLNTKFITAEFGADTGIGHILDVISVINKLQFTIKDSVITVRNKPPF